MPAPQSAIFHLLLDMGVPKSLTQRYWQSHWLILFSARWQQPWALSLQTAYGRRAPFISCTFDCAQLGKTRIISMISIESAEGVAVTPY
jgi:hypothetical protein